MPCSMTGYGRGEAASSAVRVVAEMKSVNHRYCDISIRLPKGLLALEDRVRKLVSEQVNRGRIDVMLSVEMLLAGDKSVRLDSVLARGYYDALLELKEALALQDRVTLAEIVSLPDVLSVEERVIDLEEVWTYAAPAVSDALTNLIEMRQQEGDALVLSIREKCDTIRSLVDGIADRAPLVVDEFRRRLERRLEEVVPSGLLDEARLGLEVAILAERASIEEELVRLESHLNQVNAILSQQGAVGRKLDFLMQEINREVNTISSKSQDLQLAGSVVEIKSELEKIREQVQNLE